MKEFLLIALAPAALVSFLLFLISAMKAASLLALKRRARLLLGAAVAAVALFLLCAPDFRVLNDETHYLNLAQSILETGKANRSQEWIWSDGRLLPFNLTLSFRPVLFPVLLSGLGLAFGVNAGVAFLLNGIALFGCFYFVAELMRNSRNDTWVLATIGVMAVNPVLAFTAASSACDTLALMFGIAAIHYWLRYFRERHPGDLDTAIFAALCLASTRVEGILAFLILWSYACVPRRGERRPSAQLAVLLAPILAIPLFAQRLHFYPHADVSTTAELASWAFLPTNLASFANAFFLDITGPFPVVLHWVGAIALGILIRQSKLKQAWPAATYIGLYFAFLMFFHDGRAELTSQARLFLPMSVALALLGASLMVEMCQKNRWLGSAGLVLVGAQLALSLPAMGRMDPYRPQPQAEELRAIRKFVEQSPLRTLFAYYNPGAIAALGRAAILPSTLAGKKEWLRLMVKTEKLGPIVLIEAWPPSPDSHIPSLHESDMRLLLEVPLSGLRTLRLLEILPSAYGATPGPEPK